MKVILFNGSPNEKGCTYTALAEVEKSLSAAGVETEIFFIGRQPVKGCIGCGACAKPGEKQCAFDNDAVYRAVEKAKKADGFVFGSPVHYAGMSAVMKSFMDHFFMWAADTWQISPPQPSSAAAGAALQRPWSSCPNTAKITTCPLSPPSTGTWSTAPNRRKWRRTRREP